MSRSRRKVKRERVYCTCWLCDLNENKRKHKEAKTKPDPEQAREIRDITPV
jgi:hypothetical protein